MSDVEKSDEWWAGVRAFADAVSKTIDEDGMEIEQAAENLGGLLNAVSAKEAPETWSKFEFQERERLDT